MTRRRARVLLVEADVPAGRPVASALEAAGFEVVWARDEAQALAALEVSPPKGLVVALDRPGLDGIAVLRRARTLDPGRLPVVVIGRDDARAALAALRAGAGHAHERPVDPAAVAESVRLALPPGALLQRIADLERPGGSRVGLIARSPAMARLLEQAQRVAPARSPLLLEGEPGTGKKRVARLVHALGPRRTERFVAVDCAAAGPPALEARLFGAAGDADAGPPAIELAEGGTLYLEHVADAPAAVQVRLLRVLQERTWERPGGGSTAADVRLVASSDRDLAGEVAAGRFRHDLHDRLGVARLAMPPLRERREDLPLLVREILRRPRRARRARAVSAGALERLLAHDWPGNVRELETTIEGMMALAGEGGTLGLEHLPAHLRPATTSAQQLVPGMTVAEAERALIAATLRHAGGDKAKAAALLGIGLRTLYRKVGARPRARAKGRPPGGR